MKIGELAALVGTNVETIRYYERERLLPKASRSEGNYRVYTKSHQECLTFIRHCRSMDMALDEIRVLLRFKENPDEDCGEVSRVLDQHIGHVSRRIAELRSLEKRLGDLRKRCMDDGQSGSCGILEGLSRQSIAKGRVENHVPGAHKTHATKVSHKSKR